MYIISAWASWVCTQAETTTQWLISLLPLSATQARPVIFSQANPQKGCRNNTKGVQNGSLSAEQAKGRKTGKIQRVQVTIHTNKFRDKLFILPMTSTWVPWHYRELWRWASACTPSDRLSNKCRLSPFPLHEFAMPDQRSGNLGLVQYWCSWQSCLFERLNSTFAWSNNLIVLTGSLLFKRFNSFCCQESEFAFSMKLSQGKAFLSQTSSKVS